MHSTISTIVPVLFVKLNISPSFRIGVQTNLLHMSAKMNNNWSSVDILNDHH